MIDLHVHSSHSDGTFSPTELVEEASKKKLTAFALTDHDTVAGIAEAVFAAGRADPPIEVIPGIEFSTNYGEVDVHVLGYGIDYCSDEFRKVIAEFVDTREIRNREMCRRLVNDGIDVPYESLLAENPGAVITRANIARYMADHGIVKDMPEAFSRYIGEGCPYYVPRTKMSPEDAVRTILRFGGVPVLAHPYQYGLDSAELNVLLDRMTEAGLMGLECLYSKYTVREREELLKLAGERKLLVTGGSDFHGTNKPCLELGTGYEDRPLAVPEKLLTGLKRALFGTSENTKLFFFDLDGTLLDDGKKITPDTFAALERISGAGHRIILCSGRPLSNVLKVHDELGLNRLGGTAVIGCNGAEAFDCGTGRTLFKEGLSLETVRKVFALADRFGVHVQTYRRDAVVCRRECPETEYYQRYVRMNFLTAEDPVSLLDEEPGKCLAIDLDGKSARLSLLRQALADELGEEADAFLSNPYYLEIISRRAGKGRAVTRTAGLLGVPCENTIAAGDSGNDISMLEAAGISIAMCNGTALTPELTGAAHFITSKDNSHDGLVPFLDYLGLPV